MKQKVEQVTYSVFQEETENGIEYGIVCEENGNPYMAINKISPNRILVEEMAEKFNDLHLAANQFMDGVEDEIP